MKTILAEVDGDTFKHCFSLKERPTEFGSKAGSEITYIAVRLSSRPRSGFCPTPTRISRTAGKAK